jgi:enoyl-CoA hydratase/carnithine racemase
VSAKFSTLIYEKASHRALIVLNRPDALNAFDKTMQRELKAAWQMVKEDEDVRVVILTGAGNKAFCSGVDLKDGDDPEAKAKKERDPWHHEDAGARLTSKQNGVWKPVITAVNGLCNAGAFYFVYDSDIVLASENATFFDTHVSYGLVTALEPIGLTRRIPLGEVLRIALVGGDERVSAKRAYEIGLVSEVVPHAELLPAAERLAASIASHPPIAVQGTVKAIWRSLDMGRQQGLEMGEMYPRLGNTPEALKQLNEKLARKDKPKWRLR